MRPPASTQAVPDTCGAAGAVSSPTEPLCTCKSPGKTSVTRHLAWSTLCACVSASLLPSDWELLQAGSPVGNMKSPPLRLGQRPQHGRSSPGPAPTV